MRQPWNSRRGGISDRRRWLLFTMLSGLLASRAELESFATAAAKLRDDVERLEQRVRRLG